MVVASLLITTGALYFAGALRVWRAVGVGRGIRRGQMVVFAAALGLLALALLPPLEPMSETSFAAHMVQHMLIATVAPPLLLLGVPATGFLWSLPRRGRRAVALRARRWSRGSAWVLITTPGIACLLHAVAIWAWHAPVFYEAALHREVVHAVEHATLLGTGMLLWWRIVRPSGSRRAAYGAGMIMLFITAMHTGILGALIALSPRVLYPGQTAAANPLALSAMVDQELAGLVMWVIGGGLYIVAIAMLFVGWLEPGARRAWSRKAATAAVAGAIVTTDCSRPPASVAGGDARRGEQLIAATGCGACHEIAGIRGARGAVGPPLTNVRRRAIIGGALPNTPENMTLWIEDPPSISRNTAMPNLGLTPQQARDIVAYLYTHD